MSFLWELVRWKVLESSLLCEPIVGGYFCFMLWICARIGAILWGTQNWKFRNTDSWTMTVEPDCVSIDIRAWLQSYLFINLDTQLAVAKVCGWKSSLFSVKLRKLQYYLFEWNMMYLSDQQQSQGSQWQELLNSRARARKPEFQGASNPVSQKSGCSEPPLSQWGSEPVTKKWKAGEQPAEHFPKKRKKRLFQLQREILIKYQWKCIKKVRSFDSWFRRSSVYKEAELWFKKLSVIRSSGISDEGLVFGTILLFRGN